MYAGYAWNDKTHVRKCPQCGKTFTVAQVEEWGYKVGKDHNKVRILCSWHCLRALEKASAGQPVKRNGAAKEERNLEVYRRFMAGETSRELGLIYGVSGSTIIAWVEKARNILSEEEIANGTE